MINYVNTGLINDLQNIPDSLVLTSQELAVLNSFNSIEEIKEVGSQVSAVTFPLRLVISLILVSISWLAATLLGKSETMDTLKAFYKKTKPGGPGWKKVIKQAKSDGEDLTDGQERWEMPTQILMVFFRVCCNL